MDNVGDRVNDFKRQAADDFRQCAGSWQEQRAALRRYLRRGVDEGFSIFELVDFLDVSSPSILAMAGYSQDASVQVLEMLDDIND